MHPFNISIKIKTIYLISSSKKIWNVQGDKEYIKSINVVLNILRQKTIEERLRMKIA